MQILKGGYEYSGFTKILPNKIPMLNLCVTFICEGGMAWTNIWPFAIGNI